MHEVQGEVLSEMHCEGEMDAVQEGEVHDGREGGGQDDGANHEDEVQGDEVNDRVSNAKDDDVVHGEDEMHGEGVVHDELRGEEEMHDDELVHDELRDDDKHKEGDDEMHDWVHDDAVHGVHGEDAEEGREMGKDCPSTMAVQLKRMKYKSTLEKQAIRGTFNDNGKYNETGEGIKNMVAGPGTEVHQQHQGGVRARWPEREKKVRGE